MKQDCPCLIMIKLGEGCVLVSYVKAPWAYFAGLVERMTTEGERGVGCFFGDSF